jgi:hypothetical protein
MQWQAERTATASSASHFHAASKQHALLYVSDTWLIPLTTSCSAAAAAAAAAVHSVCLLL